MALPRYGNGVGPSLWFLFPAACSCYSFLADSPAWTSKVWITTPISIATTQTSFTTCPIKTLYPGGIFPCWPLPFLFSLPEFEDPVLFGVLGFDRVPPTGPVEAAQ